MKRAQVGSLGRVKRRHPPAPDPSSEASANIVTISSVQKGECAAFFDHFAAWAYTAAYGFHHSSLREEAQNSSHSWRCCSSGGFINRERAAQSAVEGVMESAQLLQRQSGKSGKCGKCGKSGKCGRCGKRGKCGECGKRGKHGRCGRCGRCGKCGRSGRRGKSSDGRALRTPCRQVQRDPKKEVAGVIVFTAIVLHGRWLVRRT